MMTRRDQMEPGLHDDTLKRVTTQCVSPPPRQKTGQGFSLGALTRGETTSTPSRGTRHTWASPPLVLQSFRPEPLTHATHRNDEHLAIPREDLPPPKQTCTTRSARCYFRSTINTRVTHRYFPSPPFVQRTQPSPLP